MSETDVYELAVLYRSDFEDTLDKVAEKVKKLIADQGGKIIKEDVWGKRQLAYEIKKQTHALYVFYDIEISGLVLNKIESSLNISEEILRYQFYKPDLKARDLALANQAAREKYRATHKKATEAEASEKEVKQNVS